MDSLEYIDSYFKGERSPEDTRQFEKRIQDDPVFAKEVAYYLSAYAAFKEKHAEERKTSFRGIYDQAASASKVRQMKIRRWLPVMAVAVLIAAIVLYWLLAPKVEAPQLADQYIRQNLNMLSVKMGTADSIQTGLDLYNRKKFPEASQQFESILRSDSLNPTALLDAGIVYLRMQNYDKALEYFKKLEAHTDPRLKPSLFYEALTLMKRNHAGDPAHAKQFLNQVVQQDLNKKEDALQLLRQMK